MEIGYDLVINTWPDLAGELNIILVVGGRKMTIVGAGLGMLGDRENPFCLSGSLPKVPGRAYGCLGATINSNGFNFGASIDVNIPDENYCSPFNCQLSGSVGFNCGVTMNDYGASINCSPPNPL